MTNDGRPHCVEGREPLSSGGEAAGGGGRAEVPPAAQARPGVVFLAGAVLALLGAALIAAAALGHSWLRPKKSPDPGIGGGIGLWSTVVTRGDESRSRTHLDMIRDAEKAAKELGDFSSPVANDQSRLLDARLRAEANKALGQTKLFAWGSMGFFIDNWLVVALLAAAALFGFLRVGGRGSPEAAFRLVVVAAVIGLAGVGFWLFASVLSTDILDDTKLGISFVLWWLGMLPALVAVVLFRKARGAAFAALAGDFDG
jgi:hypothetical protein